MFPNEIERKKQLGYTLIEHIGENLAQYLMRGDAKQYYGLIEKIALCGFNKTSPEDVLRQFVQEKAARSGKGR